MILHCGMVIRAKILCSFFWVKSRNFKCLWFCLFCFIVVLRCFLRRNRIRISFFGWGLVINCRSRLAWSMRIFLLVHNYFVLHCLWYFLIVLLFVFFQFCILLLWGAEFRLITILVKDGFNVLILLLITLVDNIFSMKRCWNFNVGIVFLLHFSHFDIFNVT